MMADKEMKRSYSYCMNHIGIANRCNRRVPTDELYCSTCVRLRNIVTPVVDRDREKGTRCLAKSEGSVTQGPVSTMKRRDRSAYRSECLESVLGPECAGKLIKQAYEDIGNGIVTRD